MNYYIFRVQDSLNQEYYLVNNKYIGYLDFDSNYIRALLESKKCKHKYQLFAESIELQSDGVLDRELHELTCNDTRLTTEQVTKLVNDNIQLSFSDDDTWYEMFYPDRHSSKCYLKEIDGNKTIK